MAATRPVNTRQRVFEFVEKRLLEGRPPTVRDVQVAIGFRAVESARSHLEALVAEGKLLKEPGRARGYALPRGDGRQPPTWVPLMGQVQAGNLTPALEAPEGYLPVQVRGSGKDLFALRVQGESMSGAGLLPRDIVIVRRQTRAEDGDIVVALVGDEATVKTLRIRRRRIELHPANPDFEVVIPDPAAMQILGKVVEVRRILS